MASSHSPIEKTENKSDVTPPGELTLEFDDATLKGEFLMNK